MNSLYDAVVVADSLPRMSEVTRAIGPLASLKLVNLDGQGRLDAVASRLGIINIDLTSSRSIERFKALTATIKLDNKPRLFAASKASHREIVQSYALGATEIVAAPIEGRQLVDRIHGLVAEAVTAETAERGSIQIAVGSGATVLRDLLHATRYGLTLPAEKIDPVCESLVESLMDYPVDRWLAIMRTNHQQTFEHCLTVTGTAISFGLAVGFGRQDLVRIASCALVHDVGKSFIPLGILDKPGRLDDEETRLVRLHPFLGHAALAKNPRIDADMLDATLNHHEYLDGSGYPNGLAGTAISDIARIITIADIFSALIERRAYKRPMPAGDAYQILDSMEGKLDKPLVRAFKPVAARISRLIPDD